MEGHCSTGQSRQWAVLLMEEEEEKEEQEQEKVALTVFKPGNRSFDDTLKAKCSIHLYTAGRDHLEASVGIKLRSYDWHT